MEAADFTREMGKMKKVSVIGSGFAGLASATVLAQAGFDVTVFEKNSLPGGRARKFEAEGYIFDMGPSWYWMPDVFEKYFQRFGKSASDFYTLVRLDPSYRIYFGTDDYLDIPAGVEPLCRLFDSIEPGSSKHLIRFLQEGKVKYEVGFKQLAFKPGLSVSELFDTRLLKGIFQLHVFQSLSRYVRKFFKDPRIIRILEFPVLFLGAAPADTPALYSLMNYADMALGTWYPMGGMYKIVDAMVCIAEEQGVTFRFNHTAERFEMNRASVKGIWSNNKFHASDFIVAGADYHHVEQQLLPKPFRQYNESYWNSRTLAPSSLIFYLGVSKRIPNLLHHTLFFDESFELHAKEIYKTPAWPSSPQFYVSCPSKTDASIAPDGHENLMILIPVAPGLQDTEEIRGSYFDMVIDRLERLTRSAIREHIIFSRSYAHRDFASDYNAYKGNAYGLANTLLQTANLKPRIINKRVTNLFYTGQLTVPGPGVPPALISGQVVAEHLKRICDKT